MLIQGLKFLANVILYPIWMIGYIVTTTLSIERIGFLLLGLLSWLFGALVIYLNI